MSLIDELEKYKYIGFPFEAFGWPGPIKQRLVGSNDGLNWNVLKEYDWGWRDTDMMKIGNRYFICATDDCVHYTDDFETFIPIPVKSGYKMSWAPEWFKDKDGTIYMFYAASDSTSVYFKMLCRTFNPDTFEWGEPIQVNFENDNASRIDPNVHYINGKYYMWIANQQTHDIELYSANYFNGTYKQIPTNIHSMMREAGFNRDEAPEMLKINETYYLYSDPWNDGSTDENKRMLYRASSTDMVNWNIMTKCNCAFGMRHFTPLLLNNNDFINTSLSLEFWDGNPGTFEITNQNNFKNIMNIIEKINELAKTNSIFLPQTINLDTKILTNLNRGARNQFLNNAAILNTVLPDLFNDYRYSTGDIKDVQKKYQEPNIPTNLVIDKDEINNYWNVVDYDLSLVIKTINKEDK